MRSALALALAVVLALDHAATRAADAPPRRYPRDRPIDVISETLDLDVDLEAQAISGTATIVFAANAAPVRRIELDAVDLDVGAVREVPARRPLRFLATGEKLAIELAEPLGPGAGATIAIDYRAAPRAGLYFFGPTERDPRVPIQVWSQGQSEGSRRWFPCVDTPEERQATELIVRAPRGFEVLSNGALQGPPVEVDGGKMRWHWKQEFPHPAYLVTLVVGKFAVRREEWRGIPILTYVPPERAEDAPRSFGETRAMLDLFSERFGVPYPFEKYAQVVVEQFIHGGMENTSAATLNEYTLHDERAHLDYSSEGLVAHELAHQWWGDLVTCRDWAHIWLNEGFASYGEAVWEEGKRGADAYDYEMFAMSHGALEGGRELPLVRRRYRDPDECFGGGAYPKGAWVLHMLRREVGDELFWRGLRAYAEEWKGRAVETEDLRKTFERATGRSLGEFFWQWTERAGHPVLEVSATWREDDRLLEVAVAQKQGGEPFAFRCELAVVTAEGKRLAFPVRVDEREQTIYLPLATRPRWFRFDDREAVLKEIAVRADRDQLVAALEAEPRAIARIEAARALGRDRSDEAVDALGRALLREKFWGAAVEIAKALGEVPGDRARDALLGATGVEDPRARRAVVEALGSFHRDPKVAGALLALAAKGDPSVYVEAAVGEALARTRDPRAFEVLARMLRAKATRSSEETLRTAALRGLAELPDLRGLELALAHAGPDERRSVRAAAIEAAGRLAGRKECPEETRQAVAERIAGILEDSNAALKSAAIGALRDMGAEKALPALEALARHDPREDLRERAHEAAAKIRAGAPPDAEMARLREDLKTYAEENRKLRERLDRLEARGEEAKGAAAGDR